MASMLGASVSLFGEVYAVGSRALEYQVEDGWYLHLAADGTLQNEILQDLAADVEFEDVALTSGGNAVVVGYEQALDEVETVVFSVAPDGTVVWRTSVELGVDIGAGFWLRRVAVSANGRIAVGSAGRGADGAWSAGLVELSPVGERVRALPLPSDEHPDLALQDLGFDPNGVLYAGMSGRSTLGGEDLEWVGRWDVGGGFLGSWEHAEFGSRVVEISPRVDGVTVLGVDYAREDPPYVVRPLLRRYDEDGFERWAAVIDLPSIGDDVLFASDLVTDCQGRAVVFATHGLETWFFTYDDDGNEVDRRLVELDVGLGTYAPGIYDVAVDPFGNIVLAMSLVESPGGLIVQALARP